MLRLQIRESVRNSGTHNQTRGCLIVGTTNSHYLGVTEFLGSLKISLSEERRLKDTQNLKCEDGRFQNYLVLKTEDLITKPTKPEDRRFAFLTGKI